MVCFLASRNRNLYLESTQEVFPKVDETDLRTVTYPEHRVCSTSQRLLMSESTPRFLFQMSDGRWDCAAYRTGFCVSLVEVKCTQIAGDILYLA